jgi:DNA-binding transcriptional regulator YhcF (GntR family)
MSLPNHGVSRQLKRILANEIISGRYRPGSQLPSVRSFGLQLGVDKNTVAIAYRQLQQEGLVYVVVGKGTFVVDLQKTSYIDRVSAKLLEDLTQILQSAEASGLDPGQITDITHQAVSALSDGDVSRLAFVECNQRDAQSLAEALQSRLRLDIEPVVLPEQPGEQSRILSFFDIVITPLFHLREVSQALAGSSTRVIGIVLTLAYDTMVTLAHMDSTVTVGLVVSGDKRMSLESLTALVGSSTRAAVASCCVSDVNRLSEILGEAHVVMDTLSCHQQLMEFRPTVEATTLRFEIDERSINYLSRHIPVLQREAKRGAS